MACCGCGIYSSTVLKSRPIISHRLPDPSATLCKDCTEKLLKPAMESASPLPSSPPTTSTGSENGDSGAATPTPAAAAPAVPSSTKIAKLLEVLEDTRARFPGQKTIVFSQFTSMLDLLEEPLKTADFKFCRYDGTMPNHLRERSIDLLKKDPKMTVMLISLKCGSLGYSIKNLSIANAHFITLLLDQIESDGGKPRDIDGCVVESGGGRYVAVISFVYLPISRLNFPLIDQAIDRVHRIGQRLEVHVTRLMIKDTVEEKIIQLQEKKVGISFVFCVSS
ncbi:P-loop containing nucleoside triphosphate hydrolase protein [Jimgerdemannia flammicorona]|uniref:P-loop containing nucleoside triphosphate hydrolase protein n=1 Tax=Jimgerdemannia flammicorona TaxID=994334 RepID=A0A433A2S1_9FUNG|nr:P-loop containing nucleoside triphosphate hydrolase protein [Jimgerdemannia flammicorona]